MTPEQQQMLQNTLDLHNIEDNTELIRTLKHSARLRAEVAKLVEMRERISDPDQLHFEGVYECEFLHTYYTVIYNKVRKNEVDLGILDSLFCALEDIEEGRLDQHVASVKVGELLKKMYVDSAMRRAEKLDAVHEEETKANEYRSADAEKSTLTWKDYKARRGQAPATAPVAPASAPASAPSADGEALAARYRARMRELRQQRR